MLQKDRKNVKNMILIIRYLGNSFKKVRFFWYFFTLLYNFCIIFAVRKVTKNFIL